MSEITPNTPNPVREDAYKTELATKLGIDPQYIPSSPVWRNEEEIAAIAEMFANMSGSSGGGVLVVHETVSDMTHTLDKTWQEIVDAGFAVLYITSSNGSTDIYELRNFGHDAVIGYQVTFYDLQQGVWAYQVDSATGYPSYEE